MPNVPFPLSSAFPPTKTNESTKTHLEPKGKRRTPDSAAGAVERGVSARRGAPQRRRQVNVPQPERVSSIPTRSVLSRLSVRRGGVPARRRGGEEEHETIEEGKPL